MAEKMKVLIAYDAVNPIEKAINDLKRSGLPKNVEAMVYTVADAFVPQAVSYSNIGFPDAEIGYYETMCQDVQTQTEQQLQQSKQDAKEAANRLQSAFPEWKVLSNACVDSPATAILKKADEWRVDLIVMGSHSKSALARIFLGSVSQKVLTHAKCSVRIVRAQVKENTGPMHILIGMDGSGDSALAVATVAERVWPQGTLVNVVTGFNLSMSSAIAFHRHMPMEEKATDTKEVGEQAWVQRMTASSVKKLKNAGLGVLETVKVGDPWHVLVKEAEDWHADSIFIGARGLGAVDRFLLGSVSSSAAARAHCSVEVVRRGN